MKPTIKYFVTSDYAMLEQDTGKISASGIFDSFINTIYPAQSPRFFIVSAFTGIQEDIEIAIEIKAPSDETLLRIDWLAEAQPENHIVQGVFQIDSIPLPEKGLYIINIFESSSGNVIAQYPLLCMYPPKREFSDDEIKSILGDPGMIKGAQISIKCPRCQKEYLLDLHLDPDKETKEGCIQFPEDNILECCDTKLDITGVRYQIEQSYGLPLPPKK